MPVVRVDIRHEKFNCWQELSDYETEVAQGKFGACCNFVGSMRDFNQGDTVTGMFLEHYPSMTESELNKIAKEAQEQWGLEGVLLIHRVGHIKPADNIVITAAWSAHRNEAFLACRYMIEELKQRATFWKKEVTEETSRWVEGSQLIEHKDASQ